MYELVADKLGAFARHKIDCLPELVHFLKSNQQSDDGRKNIRDLERQLARKGLTKGEYGRAIATAQALPLINVNWSMESDVFGPNVSLHAIHNRLCSLGLL